MAAYKAKLKEVSKWGDGLGYRMDPGIVKLVTLFNLLGYRTTGSCEGHTDPTHALLSPWIDFAPKKGKGTKELRNIIKNYRIHEYQRTGTTVPELFSPYIVPRIAPPRVRVQIGQDPTEDASEKSRIPPSVRRWFVREKHKALDRFTDCIAKWYFGEL